MGVGSLSSLKRFVSCDWKVEWRFLGGGLGFIVVDFEAVRFK